MKSYISETFKNGRNQPFPEGKKLSYIEKLARAKTSRWEHLACLKRERKVFKKGSGKETHFEPYLSIIIFKNCEQLLGTIEELLSFNPHIQK